MLLHILVAVVVVSNLFLSAYLTLFTRIIILMRSLSISFLSKSKFPTWIRNMATITALPTKRKIVVIMGATGSGKSKLSVDLATRFFKNSEIINSDKIQVSKGLDITTNKISMSERRGVVHHLLGEFFEFSASDFRKVAADRISDIVNRRKLPFIVGGSNSYIYALLSNRFDPKLDIFQESNPVQILSNDLRYNCCFIWVDVKPPVLNQYLDKRVDEMMNSGMYEELEEYFEINGFSDTGLGSNSVSQYNGLRKAIGVPEMEKYFKRYKSCTVQEKCRLYEEAVREIKENTRQLAEKQMWKIERLREAGWDLHRLDATLAVRATMTPESRKIPAKEIWGKQVLEPSVKIVKHFLLE